MKIKLHEDIKQGEDKEWKLEKWMRTVGLSIDENIDLIKGLKITEMYFFVTNLNVCCKRLTDIKLKDKNDFTTGKNWNQVRSERVNRSVFRHI